MPTRLRFRRLLALSTILAYLGVTAFAFALHVVGDTGFHPLQYLATWDMFPGYRSTSRRLLVIGETEAGRFVRLYPNANQRWRGGHYDELTRLDFAAEPLSNPYRQPLRTSVAEAIARHEAERDDDVKTVHWMLETWPARFQLPDDLDAAEHGKSSRQERTHRVLAREPAEAVRE